MLSGNTRSSMLRAARLLRENRPVKVETAVVAIDRSVKRDRCKAGAQPDAPLQGEPLCEQPCALAEDGAIRRSWVIGMDGAESCSSTLDVALADEMEERVSRRKEISFS